MTELLGLDEAELRQHAEGRGLSAYRGSQLYRAIYRERCWDLGRMTTLSGELRDTLASDCSITIPRVTAKYVSKDGSVRYVLQLAGDKPVTIEAVWMPEDDRQTLCISTQAGCAVDCRFCATAKLGLVRNLSAGEIAGQVLAVLDQHRDELHARTNVVLMGQGEPLHNYDATLKAVRLMSDPKGMSIPLRRITLSTSGIVPGIERLATEEIRPKLALSLNASNDEQRESIMPLNKKWPLARLMDALQQLPLRRWEFIMFEYVLLGGFNDSDEDAHRVVKLASRLKCKINLIPWNPVPSLPFHAPEERRVLAFQKILMDAGFKAFIRKSRGQDVFAACGQLSLLEITNS